MGYFTIFQDKLHSVNVQDEPNRSKISENFQNHPYGHYLSCYLMVSVITMCNLIKRLIRATFLSTPASDGHER